MTTYTLTANDDDLIGTGGTDIFEGPAGGANDQLRGGGGNDFFFIQNGQTGLIAGGTGRDLVHLKGPGYNALDAGLTLLSIEDLIIDSTNLFATVKQLQGVTHFGINNNSEQFSLFLQGAGGTLDFSSSFTDPQALSVEAEMATSAVRITGSQNNDTFIGSDFSDVFNGGLGNDTAYGSFGNDVLSGGAGRDYLYGDSGKDYFLFDAAAVKANVDHIGDFRPDEDTIRIDHDVFSWAGQELGEIARGAFKVVGTGQSVDLNDRIIYNQNTGALFYDPDGSKAGGVEAKLFAIVDNFAGDVPVLTYHDIVIV